jgi:UDP-2,3-diacylglucosamine pyrophosphatase LpxH
MDIIACGDWHIGDLFYDEGALKKFINYLECQPESVQFLMGDLGRYFPYSDRLNRADETAATKYPTVASQLREVERIIEMIPKQAHVFLHHGNHENHVFKEMGSGIYKALAERTGCDYIGFQAAVLLHWPGRYTRILSTHGHKAVSFQNSFDPSVQGRINKNADISLRRLLTKIDGGASDIYFMGHTHHVQSVPPDTMRQMVNTGSRFVEREKYINHVTHPVWCYNTGSCTKSFPPGVNTYADEAMYGASDMACIHVRLDNNTKKPYKVPNGYDIVELT